MFLELTEDLMHGVTNSFEPTRLRSSVNGLRLMSESDLEPKPGNPDIVPKPGNPDIVPKAGNPDIVPKPGNPDIVPKPGDPDIPPH